MKSALECGFSGWPGPSRSLVFRIRKPFTIKFITASSVKGLTIKRDERNDDFAEMYVDLTATGDQQTVIADVSDEDPTSLIRIVDLLNGDFIFLASYPEELYPALSKHKKRLEAYTFSVVTVDEAPIEVATEIFTRINVSGKPLSVFEIMVAKTFKENEFDLASEYGNLVEEFTNVGYDTSPAASILQAVSAVLTKECSKKTSSDSTSRNS